MALSDHGNDPTLWEGTLLREQLGVMDPIAPWGGLCRINGTQPLVDGLPILTVNADYASEASHFWEGLDPGPDGALASAVEPLYTPTIPHTPLDPPDCFLEDTVIGFRRSFPIAETGGPEARVFVLGINALGFEEEPMREVATTAIDWLLAGP